MGIPDHRSRVDPTSETKPPVEHQAPPNGATELTSGHETGGELQSAQAALPLGDRQRMVRQRRRRPKRDYALRAAGWGVGMAAVVMLVPGQIFYFLGRQ